MQEIVTDVKRVASLEYYCLGEPALVKKDSDDETSDWHRLDRMIEKSSSDASLIQHKPGFIGETILSLSFFVCFPISFFRLVLSCLFFPGTHSIPATPYVSKIKHPFTMREGSIVCKIDCNERESLRVERDKSKSG